MAANGSKIESYGEKKVAGYTDDWHGISMTMQCADLRKTLASVHRVNQGGDTVVLDGDESYVWHRKTGKVTPIEDADGQYVFHIWVQKDEHLARKESYKILKGNKYAALVVDDEEGNAGFRRQVKQP